MSKARLLLLTTVLVAGSAGVLTVLGTGEGERPNALMPTMGGAQFWNDEKLHGGWRVQRNVLTDHCRLLDEDDVRRAWGEKAECAQALRTRRVDGLVRDNPRRLVLLVHGLAGYNWTFRSMKPALEQAGHTTELWNYASTQGSLMEHVEAFHHMMNALEHVEEVTFVAHSLGGLLLRQALADENQPWRARIKASGLVMIGTPNQGAALADRFKDDGWFRAAFEGVGQDLTSGYARKIPAPSVPYKLVAGRLNGEGNPLIPGPDDGMVAVSEVYIKPTDKPLILEAGHAGLTAEGEVIALVKAFLE